MATRRGFLFCQVFLFLFVWNLAVYDNYTSWPFVPDKSVTSLQSAISPATYTSDCDSTSSGRHNRHYGNINLT